MFFERIFSLDDFDNVQDFLPYFSSLLDSFTTKTLQIQKLVGVK